MAIPTETISRVRAPVGSNRGKDTYADRVLGHSIPNRQKRPSRWRRATMDAGTFAALVAVAPGAAHIAQAKTAIVQQDQRPPGAVLDGAIHLQAENRASRQDSSRVLSPSSLPGKVKTTHIITVHRGDNGWKIAEKEVKAAGLRVTRPTVNTFDHLLNGQAEDGISVIKPKEEIVTFSAPVNEAVGTLMETPLPKDTPAPIKEVKAELTETNHYPAGTTFEQTETEDRELVAHAATLLSEAEKPSSPVGKELRELGILTAALGPPASSLPGPQTPPPLPGNETQPPPSGPSQKEIQNEIKQIAREAGKKGYIQGLENAAEGAAAVALLAAGAILYTGKRRRRKERVRQTKEAERLHQERRLRDIIDNTRYHAALLVQAQDQERIRVISTNRQYLEEEVEAQIKGFEHFRPTDLTDGQRWALTAIKRRLYLLQRDTNTFGHDGEKEIISTTGKTDEALLMLIAHPSTILEDKVDLLTDPNTLVMDPYIRNEVNQQAIDKLLHLTGVLITKREQTQPPPQPAAQLPKLVASPAAAGPVTTFTKAASAPDNSPFRFLRRRWYMEQLKQLQRDKQKKT